MKRHVPIGDTVVIGDQSGTVTGYMDKEGMPHVAVVEMHDPIAEDEKWQCIDMTQFEVEEVVPC